MTNLLFLFVACCFTVLDAQSITLSVSNVPLSATRIVTVADGAQLGVRTRSALDFTASGGARTINIALPAAGTYRVRAIAFVRGMYLPVILATGKVTGIVVTGNTSANLTLSSVTMAADNSTPSSGVTGAPITIRVNITDSGDFVENGYGHVWYARSPFTQNLATANSVSGLVTATPSFQFSATFNLPSLTGTVYWQIDISSDVFSDSQELPILVWPNLHVAGLNQITVSAGVTITLTLNRLPAAANRAVVIVDGGGLAGVVRTSRDFTAGTSSTTMGIAVPTGGPYRIRAAAFSSGVSLPGILGSGQTTLAAISTATSVSLALGDVTVAPGPATPSAGSAGSTLTIELLVSDPGDFLAGGAGFLYTATAPFAVNAQPQGFTPLVMESPGSGAYRFTGTATLATPALYYQLIGFSPDFATGLEQPVLASPNLPGGTLPKVDAGRENPRPVITPSTLALSTRNSPVTANLSVQMSDSSSAPYQATGSAAWLSTSPASGTVPGTTVVTANPAGLGNGTVQGTISVLAGGSTTDLPVSLSVLSERANGDFQGNGRSGMVVYNPANGDLYACMSKGDGDFTCVRHPYSPGFSMVRTMYFDADNFADILLYNKDNRLGYLGAGNGQGNFAEPMNSVFWPGGINMAAAGDLNGDGLTDIVIHRSDDGTMYTGLSNGNGTFNYRYMLVSIGLSHMLMGDFNADGRSDLLIYRKSDGVAFLGISLGTGEFSFASVFNTPVNADFVQLGDFNGDGRKDLLFYNSATGAARLGMYTGSAFTWTTLNWSPGFSSVVALDFNGDGKSDVALYNKNNMLGYLGAGLGTGEFTFGSLFWGPGMDTVEALDLNGDLKSDILIYNSSTGTVYTGLSTGQAANPFTYKYLYWGIGRQLRR